MTASDVVTALDGFSAYFYVLIVFALGLEVVAFVLRMFLHALPSKDAPR